jgi:hypothetical protein
VGGDGLFLRSLFVVCFFDAPLLILRAPLHQPLWLLAVGAGRWLPPSNRVFCSVYVPRLYEAKVMPSGLDFDAKIVSIGPLISEFDRFDQRDRCARGRFF